MRVPHTVNLPDDTQNGRYRVYWTPADGSAVLKAFGVVDTIGHARGLPLEDFVVLDADQSDGLRHAQRVARCANTLAETAALMGLKITANGVTECP